MVIPFCCVAPRIGAVAVIPCRSILASLWEKSNSRPIQFQASEKKYPALIPKANWLRRFRLFDVTPSKLPVP